MHLITTSVLACAVLAAAKTQSRHGSLTARDGVQLELECVGRSLFCCDPLKSGDEDSGPNSEHGGGQFRNCAAVPNFEVTACKLQQECKRAPACCDYSEIGGPIPNPMHCVDLRTQLKDEGKEDELVCKKSDHQ